jgi:hypothetical protein
MERESIVRHFESIGARVRFQALEAPRHRRVRVPDHALTIDLAKDRHGSYFVIALARSAPELLVLQKERRERHLLLMSRNGHRFLCGHDERDWFVAELSERVSTVRAAKRALMPPAVREAAGRLSPAATERRRNALFVRQGEWFFVPTDREFPQEIIHMHEPLQRAPGSKPHVCEELCREGGRLVYIAGGRAFTPEQYAAHLRADKDGRFRRLRKEERMRNPEVYVRGSVRHPDHATVRLETWHRVYVSNEVQAGAPGSSVAFLD